MRHLDCNMANFGLATAGHKGVQVLYAPRQVGIIVDVAGTRRGIEDTCAGEEAGQGGLDAEIARFDMRKPALSRAIRRLAGVATIARIKGQDMPDAACRHGNKRSIPDHANIAFRGRRSPKERLSIKHHRYLNRRCGSKWRDVAVFAW